MIVSTIKNVNHSFNTTVCWSSAHCMELSLVAVRKQAACMLSIKRPEVTTTPRQRTWYALDGPQVSKSATTAHLMQSLI